MAKKPKYSLWWEEMVSEVNAYRNSDNLSGIKGVYAAVDGYAMPMAQMKLDAVDKKAFIKALDKIMSFRGEVLGRILSVTLDGVEYRDTHWYADWENLEEIFFGHKHNPGASLGRRATFRTPQAFQNYLRKGGHTDDVVVVGGIPFTMDEYDSAGRYITYGNLKHKKMMTVETPSGRYKPGYSFGDFSDAIVTMDDLLSWRTDINYLE
ncbi:MAG: hypothetical protein V1701_02970 [Planctomycetota bacterium]